LFVHGTPSWSFDFRYCIKNLSSNFRCIALDHIGFGLSDKPKNYTYSLSQHINNLTQLIEQLQLKDITLILHDFGGPIGLEYALKNKTNIKRIVLMNTWTGNFSDDPSFKKMERILKSPLLPFLYLNFNFSARYLLPKSFGDKKISRKILSQFTKPFSKKSNRYGTLGFAKSLLSEQQFFINQKKQIHQLTHLPILLIWGMKDQFVGAKYLNQFKQEFKHAKCIELTSAGHFPQEEESEKTMTAIRYFLESNIEYK